MTNLLTAQTFLAGWRINYNPFRPQDEFDGKTPTPAARLHTHFADWEDVSRTAKSIATDRPERSSTAIALSRWEEQCLCDSSQLEIIAQR